MPELAIGEGRLFFSRLGREVGEGRGRVPLLFIHGAGASHLSWGLQVRELARGGLCLALDLPGHGRSSPPGASSIEVYRDVVLTLLEDQGLARVVLVGHSMGGAIAQSLALAAPERVAALVLVGTGARLRVSPALLEGLAVEPATALRTIVDLSYALGAAETLRLRSLADLRSCPLDVLRGDLAACDAFDSRAALPGLRLPALIVSGSEDRMTSPKLSLELAALLEGSSLLRLEGAGHSLMIEKATELGLAIETFLAALSPL